MIRTAAAVLILAPLWLGQIEERRTEPEIVSQDLRELFGAQLEATLWDSTRVDLLTETHAIEVDWASKWAEAIGQSLYYSIVSSRSPGVVLLVRDEERERRYVYRCQTVCASRGIRLWVYDVQRRALR